jgi:CHAT domain-containing protein
MKTATQEQIIGLVFYYNNSAYVQTNEITELTEELKLTEELTEEVENLEEIEKSILTNIDVILEDYDYIECENQGSYGRHIWHKIEEELKQDIMKGFNTDRHKNNPKEKELHDKFIEEYVIEKGFNIKILNRIIFGSSNNTQTIPRDYLSDREKRIVITTIQWLGSPVGQGFLKECGFEY